jgi:hypothetical protein
MVSGVTGRKSVRTTATLRDGWCKDGIHRGPAEVLPKGERGEEVREGLLHYNNNTTYT